MKLNKYEIDNLIKDNILLKERVKELKLLICKNNEQHVVHYYKDTKQKVCVICGEQ
jgi:hypothetical protein